MRWALLGQPLPAHAVLCTRAVLFAMQALSWAGCRKKTGHPVWLPLHCMCCCAGGGLHGRCGSQWRVLHCRCGQRLCFDTPCPCSLARSLSVTPFSLPSLACTTAHSQMAVDSQAASGTGCSACHTASSCGLAAVTEPGPRCGSRCSYCIAATCIYFCLS